MNLFGSHDANRIGSHIVNRTNGIGNFRDWGHYFGASKPIDNPNYSPRKPQAEDIALQKLFRHHANDLRRRAHDLLRR